MSEGIAAAGRGGESRDEEGHKNGENEEQSVNTETPEWQVMKSHQFAPMSQLAVLVFISSKYSLG